MKYTVLLLLIFILIKFKFFGKDFNPDYLNKVQTDAINGIFVFIVFLSHMRGYLPEINGNWAISQLCSTLGQMMVTTFLFISGYGCTISFLKKGENYISKIPRNRIIPLIVNLDITVVIYIIMQKFVFDRTFNAKEIIGSLVGWTSVGNSNWYIFAILCMYVIFYISFKLFGKKESKFELFFSIIFLTILYIKIVEHFQLKSHWYYDTVLCFPFGVFYAYYKDKIYATITASNARYFSLLAFFLACFIYMNKTGFGYTAMYYNMYAICFICVVLLVMMKIRIGNKVLAFFGSHVFEIYIFQRIPMMLLVKYSPLVSDVKYYYIFFIVAFASTCLIAFLMHLLYGQIGKLIRSKN